MNIGHIVNKVTGLPILPDVVMQLNGLLKNSSRGTEDVAAMIEKDSALSSRVLRYANSSYYGLSAKVDSISRAIIVIGFNTICNLTMTAGVSNFFRDSKGCSESDLAGMWLHTLGCAVSSKVIMRRKNHMESEKAFTCGILHDIGKVVIAQAQPDEQQEIYSRSNIQGKTLIDAETEVLGADHAEIGYAIAQKWRFPDYILDAIRHHHRPSSSNLIPEFAAAVHLGDSIAKAMALGKSTEPRVTFIDPSSWEQFGISEADIKPLIASVQEEFDLAMEFWMFD